MIRFNLKWRYFGIGFLVMPKSGFCIFCGPLLIQIGGE